MISGLFSLLIKDKIEFSGTTETKYILNSLENDEQLSFQEIGHYTLRLDHELQTANREPPPSRSGVLDRIHLQ